MSQKEDEDPIDFMEQIRQLTVKVYSTMSVEDGEKIAAKRFLNGMSNRVIAQQLIPAKVTDTVQVVDRNSAMAAAASASEHSGSRLKKDMQRDDFTSSRLSRLHCFSRSKKKAKTNCPKGNKSKKAQISLIRLATSGEGHQSKSKALFRFLFQLRQVRTSRT